MNTGKRLRSMMLVFMTLAGTGACSRSSTPEPANNPVDAAAQLPPPVSDVSLEAFVKAGLDMDKAPAAATLPNPVIRPMPPFDMALSDVLSQYYVIRRSLAADTREGVKNAAARLDAALVKLKGAQSSAGNEADSLKLQGLMNDALETTKAFASSGDLEVDRVLLGKLTSPLIYLTTFFYTIDIEHQPIVYYCPMKQLAWMQEVRAMGNPYYGAKMLTCGMWVRKAGR